MVLGLLPMPPEGHLVEDLEVALEVALAMDRLPNPAEFKPP